MLVVHVELPSFDTWSGYGPNNWQGWMQTAWVEGRLSDPPHPLIAADATAHNS